MQAVTTPIVSSTRSFAPGATTWVKLSVVYLIVGVTLGIAMGATETFTLRPVHAHLNLLGLTTVALAGLIYAVFPAVGASRLARVHFWLHNTAVPIMMVALSALLLGHQQAIPFLVTAEFAAAAGILVFAANLFTNLKPGDARALR